MPDVLIQIYGGPGHTGATRVTGASPVTPERLQQAIALLRRAPVKKWDRQAREDIYAVSKKIFEWSYGFWGPLSTALQIPELATLAGFQATFARVLWGGDREGAFGPISMQTYAPTASPHFNAFVTYVANSVREFLAEDSGFIWFVVFYWFRQYLMTQLREWWDIEPHSIQDRTTEAVVQHYCGMGAAIGNGFTQQFFRSLFGSTFNEALPQNQGTNWNALFRSPAVFGRHVVNGVVEMGCILPSALLSRFGYFAGIADQTLKQFAPGAMLVAPLLFRRQISALIWNLPGNIVLTAGAAARAIRSMSNWDCFSVAHIQPQYLGPQV